MKKLIIALDGYSSCGKSTFAKLIAKKLSYAFIDTGAMYRAVALFALRNNLSDDELQARLDEVHVTFRFNAELSRSEVFLNDENIDSLIRTLEVSNNVSRVAQISAVRRKLVDMQREMGQDGGIVMDGRDIGTVVFPGADIKIFMTADVMVRANRRYQEMLAAGSRDADLEKVAKNIAQRDFQDENREDSPLKRADDAILLDNSYMTLDEQMVWFDKIYNDENN